MKSWLYLSEFDLMKFGDIGCLVSVLSKWMQRSLGRDWKHLLPFIFKHLESMIKRMGSRSIIISNSCERSPPLYCGNNINSPAGIVFLPSLSLFLFCFQGKGGKGKQRKPSQKSCLLLLKGCCSFLTSSSFTTKEKNGMMCPHLTRRKH